jgi:aspartate/glutamate racemase
VTKLIGIIGGMGAFAGLRLVEHAFNVAIANGARKDSEFPRLVYYNLAARGMDESGMSDAKVVFHQLRIAIGQMQLVGCNPILIACNSVHEIYSKLTEFCGSDLMNIVELGCHAAAELGEVGVLCSSSSRHAKLFDKELGRFGRSPIYIEASVQCKLDRVIARAITRSIGPSDAEAVVDLCSQLKVSGAKCVLFGCTEIGLVVDTKLIPLPVVDCGCVAVEQALLHG